MAIPEADKDDLLLRMKRIEGQTKGIRRLIEADTYCMDIMQQMASVHQALRGAEKILLRNHLQSCVTDALRSGDDEDANRAYREMMDLIYKLCR